VSFGVGEGARTIPAVCEGYGDWASKKLVKLAQGPSLQLSISLSAALERKYV